MATTSSAPYPFSTPYVDAIEPIRDENGSLLWQPYGSLKAIDGPTDQAWRHVEILLTGVIELAQQQEWSASFSTPARLEFFWDHSTDARGVVIFDTLGRQIVHVVHALLGYGGSGPGLSEQILRLLGVSQETIDLLQEAVWNSQPYKLIVSRQKHEIIDDVDTAYPTLEIEPEWSWWRAS